MKKNTKQAILMVSLDLFSTSGYEGVSIRDIAKAVGIKEGSIYKHFVSKKEIFDSIVEEMKIRVKDAEKEYYPAYDSMPLIAEEYSKKPFPEMKEICTSLFLYFLKDNYASKFRRMLMIEQFNNSYVKNILHEYYIDGAISYGTNLFTEMIKIGFLKDVNPKVVAINFYAPIFLLMNRYDNDPEHEEEALHLLEMHIEQFELQYVIQKYN